jgi:hypothetical protein
MNLIKDGISENGERFRVFLTKRESIAFSAIMKNFVRTLAQEGQSVILDASTIGMIKWDGAKPMSFRTDNLQMIDSAISMYLSLVKGFIEDRPENMSDEQLVEEGNRTIEISQAFKNEVLALPPKFQ